MRGIERECDIFARYLTGRPAGNYVRRKYLEAFSPALQVPLQDCGRFDRLLLALAGTHPLLTRAVDLHSRIFFPASVVRRRLVMLLALMESDAATIARLDVPDCGGITGFVLGMGGRSLVSLALFLLSLPILLPLQLLLGRCDLQQAV
jgi:hypothetical protein